MGDLLGSPRVAPLFLFLLFFLLNLFYFRHHQRVSLSISLFINFIFVAANTYYILLRRSPRAAPLFLFLLFFLLNLFYFRHYQRASLPISLLINFIFVAANTYYILLRITLRVRSYQH